MAIEDLLLKPYVAAEWRNEGFSAWTFPDPSALWNFTRFSSLRKGRRTLWHHNPGTGTFPAQTVDPDFNGNRDSDVADSDAFSLVAFPSADDWHTRVRVWWRPEHVLPTLGGIEQQPPVVELYFEANGAFHLIGTLDQPILDPSGVTTSRELSRVAPDGGNPNVGADGLWWYEQLLTPSALVQSEIMGQNPVSIRAALSCADRDASGYGTGIERVAVEIMRGAVVEEVIAFPVHLHRSYVNSRRWI